MICSKTKKWLILLLTFALVLSCFVILGVSNLKVNASGSQNESVDATYQTQLVKGTLFNAGATGGSEKVVLNACPSGQPVGTAFISDWSAAFSVSVRIKSIAMADSKIAIKLITVSSDGTRQATYQVLKSWSNDFLGAPDKDFVDADSDQLLKVASGYDGFISFNFDNLERVDGDEIDFNKQNVKYLQVEMVGKYSYKLVIGDIYANKGYNDRILRTKVYDAALNKYSAQGTVAFGFIVDFSSEESTTFAPSFEIRENTGYLDYAPFNGVFVKNLNSDGSEMVQLNFNIPASKQYWGEDCFYIRMANVGINATLVQTCVADTEGEVGFFNPSKYEFVNEIGGSGEIKTGNTLFVLNPNTYGYLKVYLTDLVHAGGGSFYNGYVQLVQVNFFRNQNNEVAVGDVYATDSAEKVYDVYNNYTPLTADNWRITKLSAGEIKTYASANDWQNIFSVIPNNGDIVFYNAVSFYVDNSLAASGDLRITHTLRNSEFTKEFVITEETEKAMFFGVDGKFSIGSAVRIPNGFKGRVIIPFSSFHTAGGEVLTTSSLWSRYQLALNTTEAFPVNDVIIKDFRLEYNAQTMDNVKLPTYVKEGDYFIGYVDGNGDTKSEGTLIAINDATVYAPYVVSDAKMLGMLEGASIRITEDQDDSGIRFTCALDDELFEQLKDDTKISVEYGMILIPTDLMGEREFILDNFIPQESGKSTVEGAELLLIVADKTYKSDDQFDTNRYFDCAIYKIYEDNYTRSFAARGYMKITLFDGSVKYYYTDYNANDNARSINYVANCYIDDPTSSFVNLNEAKKAVVLKYAGRENAED